MKTADPHPMGLYSTVAPPRPSLIHDFQAVARETRDLRFRPQIAKLVVDAGWACLLWQG